MKVYIASAKYASSSIITFSICIPAFIKISLDKKINHGLEEKGPKHWLGFATMDCIYSFKTTYPNNETLAYFHLDQMQLRHKISG